MVKGDLCRQVIVPSKLHDELVIRVDVDFQQSAYIQFDCVQGQDSGNIFSLVVRMCMGDPMLDMMSLIAPLLCGLWKAAACCNLCMVGYASLLAKAINSHAHQMLLHSQKSPDYLIYIFCLLYIIMTYLLCYIEAHFVSILAHSSESLWHYNVR